MDASVEPEELQEHIGVKLPQGDYETLGGFLLDRLGHIPTEQEVVEFENVTFTVLSMEERRIDRVRVVVTPKPEPEDEKEKD